MGLSSVLFGIRRAVLRANDPKSEEANKVCRARRSEVMRATRETCSACRYRSGHNEVHHLDNDHLNNDKRNLDCLCQRCHPYHHIGEEGPAAAERSSEAVGKRAIAALIPELSAEDLNLFQMALGMALADENEAERAKKVHRELSLRARDAQHDYGSYATSDFAAAMSALNDEDYEDRHVAPLRLVFHDGLLRQWGMAASAEHPSLPVREWERLTQRLREEVKANIEEMSRIPVA